MKKYLMSFILFLFILLALETSTGITSSSLIHPVANKTYTMGTLKGVKVSSLYARYLGVKDKTELPAELAIDFQQNLKDMWETKDDRCEAEAVTKARKALTKEYKKKVTLTTFSAYSKHVTTVVANVQSALDWKALGNHWNLNSTQIELVKSISKSFDGRDMSAYILTELMPSSDGELNKNMLDFLLRNAGQEYIEAIPALYDDWTSFGPYQFTSLAVCSMPEQKNGASIVNEFVDASQKIPGSVIKLRGDNHHKAAYMFVVYNVCLMVNGLTTKQQKTLMGMWSSNKDDLFLYCATAHHSPTNARNAAYRWIDNKAKYPFENSCNTDILTYAKNTRNNLNAI